MLYLVCLEEMEGRWVAYVPSLFGCFASDEERETAVALVPSAISNYLVWRAQKGNEAVTTEDAIDVEVDEMIREWAHPSIAGVTVNAFFAADVPPLTQEEINQCLRLVEWSYEDLLASITDLSREMLNQMVEGEWSIGGILNHTSRAEWWYLNQLDLAPAADKESLKWRERLELTHSQIVSVLPQLEGVARIEIKNGEIWSPRKMLRRLLWHRRDHTEHILKFRAKLSAG